VALGFTLLDDDQLFKETTVVLGQWINRQYVESPVSSIDSFDGIWEPFNEGESSLNLPTGISSTDAITLFTNDVLRVANDIAGNVSDRQIIFLEDPAVITTTIPYVVMDKAFWKGNSAFSFVSEYTEYLCIREEKI